MNYTSSVMIPPIYDRSSVFCVWMEAGVATENTNCEFILKVHMEGLIWILRSVPSCAVSNQLSRDEAKYYGVWKVIFKMVKWNCNTRRVRAARANCSRPFASTRMQSDESSIAICLCVRLKKTSELAISDSRIVFCFSFTSFSFCLPPSRVLPPVKLTAIAFVFDQ